MGRGALNPAERLAELPPDVRRAFAAVEAVVFDVDGVLTDGRVHLLDDGRQMLSFHVRDGSGTWMLHKSGVRVGVVTGRSTGIPELRLQALAADAIVSGCREKDVGLGSLLDRWDLAPERCAYVGDDLLDGPALRVAGLPICVADATPEVRELASYVTARRGGEGAVREVADLVLEAKGLRDALIEGHLGPRPGGVDGT